MRARAERDSKRGHLARCGITHVEAAVQHGRVGPPIYRERAESGDLGREVVDRGAVEISSLYGGDATGFPEFLRALVDDAGNGRQESELGARRDDHATSACGCRRRKAGEQRIDLSERGIVRWREPEQLRR